MHVASAGAEAANKEGSDAGAPECMMMMIVTDAAAPPAGTGRQEAPRSTSGK